MIIGVPGLGDVILKVNDIPVEQYLEKSTAEQMRWIFPSPATAEALDGARLRSMSRGPVNSEMRLLVNKGASMPWYVGGAHVLLVNVTLTATSPTAGAFADHGPHTDEQWTGRAAMVGGGNQSLSTTITYRVVEEDWPMTAGNGAPLRPEQGGLQSPGSGKPAQPIVVASQTAAPPLFVVPKPRPKFGILTIPTFTIPHDPRPKFGILTNGGKNDGGPGPPASPTPGPQETSFKDKLQSALAFFQSKNVQGVIVDLRDSFGDGQAANDNVLELLSFFVNDKLDFLVERQAVSRQTARMLPRTAFFPAARGGMSIGYPYTRPPFNTDPEAFVPISDLRQKAEFKEEGAVGPKVETAQLSGPQRPPTSVVPNVPNDPPVGTTQLRFVGPVSVLVNGRTRGSGELAAGGFRRLGEREREAFPFRMQREARAFAISRQNSGPVWSRTNAPGPGKNSIRK